MGCACVELCVSDQRAAVLTVSGDNAVDFQPDEYTRMVTEELPTYEGDYEVTPTTTAQVLPTRAHSMHEDVVINPIPSNYGLISWDGSSLMVS